MPKFGHKVQADISGNLDSDDMYLKMIGGESNDDKHGGDVESTSDTERESMVIIWVEYIRFPIKYFRSTKEKGQALPHAIVTIFSL